MYDAVGVDIEVVEPVLGIDEVRVHRTRDASTAGRIAIGPDAVVREFGEMARGAERRGALGVDLRNGAVERVTRDHVSPTDDRPDVPALVAGGTKDESAIVDLREDVIRRSRRSGRSRAATRRRRSPVRDG